MQNLTKLKFDNQEYDISDQNQVKKTGDETIQGVKTFDSSPIIPTPTTDDQAQNKEYVDTKVSGLQTEQYVNGAVQNIEIPEIQAATSTTLGTIKIRFQGGNLYIRTDGSNA